MWQRINKILGQGIFLLLWLITTIASAQSHGLEIAPRLGVSTVGRSAQLHGKPGLAYGAELAYSFRGRISPDAIVGLRVGLGFSGAGMTIEGQTEDRYTNYDYQNRRMDYYNHASISDKHTIYRVELPLMAAISFFGVTLHTGPRLQWHIADRSDLTLSDPMISATYTDYGVTLTNRVVTGVLTDSPYRQSGTFSLPKGRLQWGAEAGYEWVISEGFYSQQRLGVALCFYYDIVSFAGTEAPDRVIDVAPIRNAVNPAPAVTVHSPAGQLAQLHGMEIALRLTYAIESIDYQGYGWHNRRAPMRSRYYRRGHR